MSIGDVDGDGQADLVVVNRIDSSDASIVGGMPSVVSVLHNAGRGAFDAPVSYEVGVGAWWGLLADLNGDGSLDVAVVNATVDASVFYNNGTGAFLTPIRFGVGGEPSTCRPAR